MVSGIWKIGHFIYMKTRLYTEHAVLLNVHACAYKCWTAKYIAILQDEILKVNRLVFGANKTLNTS